MTNLIVYIHGKGSSAEEAEHYKALFKDCEVVGLDYAAKSPWKAKDEFPSLFDSICRDCESVTVIANSENGSQSMKLTFEEIQNIAGIPIDHSFLKYKKELTEYGYEVGKISMKEQTVIFDRIV